MRKTLSVFLMMFVCITLQAETLIGKVIRITDGDTFTLLVDKKQHRIRLYGIDTPETKGEQPIHRNLRTAWHP